MENGRQNTFFGSPKVGAVVVGAGSSRRMGGMDKLFLPLLGTPVLVRTLLAFERCDLISEIVVVTKEESAEKVRTLAEEYGITKLKAVVLGGNERADSVKNGVLALGEDVEFVAIQDGARPLVEPEEIARCAEDAFQYGGAILAVPVVDTIKYGKKNGLVEYTPAREKLFAVQTPQIFEKTAYLEAMERALSERRDWTDDSQYFENDGRKVFLTAGSRRNIKITSPEDLLIAEAFLRDREKGEEA